MKKIILPSAFLITFLVSLIGFSPVSAIFCGDGADAGTCASGMDVTRLCCASSLAACQAACY